jgi:hypothetical protein
MNGHRSLLRLLLAGIALAAAAPFAGALFEAHLDPFGTLVADRLALLPETGGTKTEVKQRKALLKALAALAAESADRVGDLKAAKKAAAAVQGPLAADALLLGVLDEALDDYHSDADVDVLACDDLLPAFPEGRLKDKLVKKLLGVGTLLDKDDEAATLPARAAVLGKALKKLAPILEALEEGPPVGDCPPPSIYDVDLGTVTAKIDEIAWSATDLDVLLIVDSGTGDVIQLGLTVSRPDGEGGTLDTIEFTLDTGVYTGPGTYAFDDFSPYIMSMRYYPPTGSFVYQGIAGSVTITEFTFDPTDADPSIAGGRLVGTFTMDGCTVADGSGTCPASAVSITEGTFEVCNFDVIYY